MFMVKGNITPKNILHFGKDTVDDEDVVEDMIRIDNILDFVSSDNVSDALKNLYGKSGLLKGVKPINPKHKIAGFIRTVETNSDDWGTGIKGIYACDEDEILVIKCSNDNYAIWGGLASYSAKIHGLKGTVIIGLSRDTSDVLEMDFPLFSRGVMSSAGFPYNNGSIDSPLLVDNLVIESGDFIICDVDGCVVVSRNCLDDVLDELNNIKNFENDCIKSLSEGKLGLDDLVGF